jgi:hypothetical protein
MRKHITVVEAVSVMHIRSKWTASETSIPLLEFFWRSSVSLLELVPFLSDSGTGGLSVWRNVFAGW